ncbi:phytanoyl-CoA dioxygenase family protein [Actinomadura bangladeshensis]|uniref:Phytanoyl-CoA dioxygenase family protein n=1 Tax=Actinomadura bangladeshensis TaxID=453573 RepID=A0A6L9QCR5_9ACTN|nr:phytanoyl-CoA dioxygenase family protein [Actinomadura bangladeshensis]NEA23065.1 phytanoyl-CoA dioxygenase family protein [Actinomadura bangladeshensis]
MGAGYRILSEDQAEHFLDRGYVVINDCFTPEAAEEYTRTIWTRLGYDPEDRSTWTEPGTHLPAHREMDIKEFAPKAWDAVCDLVGGESRIKQPYNWGDGFVVNLSQGSEEPWTPPSAQSPGWHKDGDFFRHFLDSPEQGLLTLVLWSDVQHQGGATFVAADSIAPVARFLADHPEGVLPTDFPYAGLVGQCADFVEATGRIGDVYLLHPYILHAKAQNLLRRPRFITNPPVTLAEPMNFNRPNPADFSLVERTILRALAVDHYDFTPTAPREEVIPERVLRQARMKSEEEARLAAQPN